MCFVFTFTVGSSSWLFVFLVIIVCDSVLVSLGARFPIVSGWRCSRHFLFTGDFCYKPLVAQFADLFDPVVHAIFCKLLNPIVTRIALLHSLKSKFQYGNRKYSSDDCDY